MRKIITTEDGTTTPSPATGKGRPPVETVKDHWISFRVTAAEHYQLMEKAARSGMTAGAYARSRALRGIARKRKEVQTPGELFGETTRALLHELRKQGTNLNQIAHHCNRHQIPPPPGLIELIRLLQEAWAKVLR